jgi:hypothetical protein
MLRCFIKDGIADPSWRSVRDEIRVHRLAYEVRAISADGAPVILRASPLLGSRDAAARSSTSGAPSEVAQTEVAMFSDAEWPET